MNVEMRMPDLATTGAPLRIVRWLVQVGQAVHRGQALLEVETDKAVMEVESSLSGRLSAITAHDGAEVSAGACIALVETASAAPASSGRLSFFERNRRARQSQSAAATDGAGLAAASAGAPAIALSVAQRVAARRMEQSKQTIPHFYLQSSAFAGAMVARRQEAGTPLLWDAFFVRAAARALVKYPMLGYRFEDDRLIPQGVDAVGVAVDLEGELFTLAVDRPAAKSLEQLSAEIAAGAARLRSGDPRARLSQRANLTVSNLGGAGVESFLAVINPPESAILAVGRVMPVVAVVDGQVSVQQRVNLSLSVDHRIVGGSYAARFLAAVVADLEAP